MKQFTFNRYLNYIATEHTHNIDSINIRRLIMEPVPLFNKNRYEHIFFSKYMYIILCIV